MTKKVIVGLIILSIFGFLFSTTLIVDQWNGPYYTIGDAYSSANDGDVIEIYPGVYSENLEIEKQLQNT